MKQRRPRQRITHLLSMAQRCAPYLLRDQRRQLTKDFHALLKQEAKQLEIPPHKAVRLWNSVLKRAMATAIMRGMIFLPYLGLFRLIGGRMPQSRRKRLQWTWCWYFDPTGQPMHRLIQKLQSKSTGVAALKQLPEAILTEASLLGRLADVPYWQSIASSIVPDALSVSR